MSASASICGFCDGLDSLSHPGACTPFAEEEGQDPENKENEEANLRNARCGSGDAAEAKQASDDRNDKEYQGPV
jgi:hypothetical protein